MCWLSQLNFYKQIPQHTAKMPSQIKYCPSIEKSPLDKREFRGIEMGNKMKVLLISDPLTDKSAASISVAAGSMCDPDDIPGLAHLCEHMLFLGTKKYKTENEFSKFLSENGGSCNAFTDRDNTNYYFDVSPNFLCSALDRLSQFFICPLFTECATEREINAVHSEHEKNITNDLWRAFQLDATTTNPLHPYSRFTTGNRQTLWEYPRSRKIDVQKILLKFHKKYYSANLMCLCVLGSETLNELQDMIEKMFSKVKNTDVDIPKWHLSPYSKEVLGTCIEIVPIKDLKLLLMMFPMPDTTLRYRSAGGAYLSFLIRHKCEGGLLSVLKGKNWVNHVDAGSYVPARGFGIFKISLQLTPEGMENVEDITIHIFQYLKMLSCEVGPQKWLWEEIRDIHAMLFRFKDKEKAQNLVSSLTTVMHSIPLHDVWSAGYLITDYDAKLIENLLGLLNPDNCRMMVSSQEFADKAESTEKWYGVKYRLTQIEETLIQRWRTCGSSPKFELPPKNEFIPSEFDLKPRESDNGIIPTVFEKDGFQKVYFVQDNEFNVPKAVVRVEIFCALPLLSPLNTNLIKLFASCVKDQLTEYSHSASVAGLQYNIIGTYAGIEIRINGYDHKLPILLKKIIHSILNITIDSKRFEIVKEFYARNLKNWENEHPHQHAKNYFTYILKEKRWSDEELLGALGGATFDALTHFAEEFLFKTRLEWLVCGNFTLKETDVLLSEIQIMFYNKGSQPIPLEQTSKIREINLQNGKNYIYCRQHPTHLSSCAAIYYQTGLMSNRDNVLLELVELICNGPCFHQLRTQEQLGYLVNTNVRRGSGTQGMTIIVQSDRHPPFLETRIQDFMQTIEKVLLSMTKEEFLQMRKSLYLRKSEKPKNLMDRAQLLWNEITTGNYNFDRQRAELKELETIDQTETINYFKKFMAFDSITKKQLSVHVTSKSRWMTNGEDLDEFKNYPKPSYIQEQIIDVTEWKDGKCLYHTL